MAKLKFSVNAWDREANFLYQNRASHSNNDHSAHSPSRNASKQLFRFRFMPSQFETHGTAASRTRQPTDRAPCPPRTDNPNTRPEPSERQQKTAPHSQEPRQKHRQTETPEKIPETVTRMEEQKPRRGSHSRSRSEARATPRRSHSPRSHHKTRRGFNRCIHGQTTTAEENAPQNAIHGAGVNPHNCHAGQMPTERH